MKHGNNTSAFGRKWWRATVRRASQRWKALGRVGGSAATVLFAALVLGLELIGVTDFTEATLTLPYYFETRHALGLGPRMSPRLKIYAFDDASVNRLQRPDLTLAEWTVALQRIDAQKPRAIVLDKVFALLFDPSGCQAECIERLRAIQSPLYVGAFASEIPQRWRTSLDLEHPLYDLGKARRANSPLPPHQDYSRWTVYGPHPDLASSFDGAGHLHYDEAGHVDAFFVLSEHRYLPAMPLLVAEERRFEDGAFLVDGRLVPLDRNGRIPVNFVWPDDIYAAGRRLGSLIADESAAKAAQHVSQGDTVLILAGMFTGSTDFHRTPVGNVPGGLVQASLLNSVLEAPWLTPLPHAWLLSLAMCIAGALWGASTRSLLYWSVQVAGSMLPVALGCYLFAWHGVIIPLVIPILGFWGCSLIQFADGTLKREKKARRIEAELSDAAEIAKVFRPDEVPHWDGLAIAVYHQPLAETSGDWFTFASSPTGRFRHFIMTDVAGHGMQAALILSVAKTVLAMTKHDHQASLESPSFIADYVQRLNAMLYYHGRGHHLITVLGITFDRQTASIHHTSCGHPAPILYSPKAEGRVKIAFLPLHTTIIGLSESVAPIMQTRPLRPGEELICYTDGMPVGRSVRRLSSFFVEERRDLRDAPKILFDQLWEAETKRTGRSRDDDASVVWFKAA
jgi:hypothetical protein